MVVGIHSQQEMMDASQICFGFPLIGSRSQTSQGSYFARPTGCPCARVASDLNHIGIGLQFVQVDFFWRLILEGLNNVNQPPHNLFYKFFDHSVKVLMYLNSVSSCT